MPGKVKIKVISGRNLPVMDRSSDTTDAYVEIKLGNTSYKTDVCRKSLNPLWNSEWYRFEVDDLELQDEPLQIRLMDHDTYSANDAIGKVYLNLNPLLTPAAGLSTKYGWSGDASLKNQPSSSIMSGWIPVYDTMHGVRGEVNVTVKVELFTDLNKFRQSSCGVQFFCSPSVPYGYHTQVIHGFVEELVVNDDPEYQWIDKIRTPRASNEARQTLFFKLSGELQRKIGVKTLDLGGNAVIGYTQCFDLEGESGIVARGIGTAVTLAKLYDLHQQVDERIAEESVSELPTQNQLTIQTQITTMQNQLTENLSGSRRSHHRTDSTGGKIMYSPARLNSIPCIHRRSSDSDLSITPKGNSLTGSDKSTNAVSNYQYSRNTLLHPVGDNFDMMEYPFLTLTKYPPGFILHIGSAISARSVKLLERITNIEEPESRDTWWSELRMEIRSHARALNCNAVLGYNETTSICDEICVLSASGTAAVINLSGNGDQIYGINNMPNLNKLNVSNKDLTTTSLDRTDFEQDNKTLKVIDNTLLYNASIMSSNNENIEQDLGNNECSSTSDNPIASCAICHIPYNETNISFRMTVSNCSMCKQAKVSDVLLTTIDIPENVPSTGRVCFLQSYICRPKKDLKGELNAKEISESLPFLEYELHRLLINKMKVKGMNTIFGLKVRITIGEKLLVGVATGSAMYLLPLPTPSLPKLIGGNSLTSEGKILEMQKLLVETVKKNREIYEIKNPDPEVSTSNISITYEPYEKKSSVDMSLSTKDCCVLEVDDSEDIEVINLLIEPKPPDGFNILNSEILPGSEELELAKNLQMVTQVWRAKIQPNQSTSNLDKYFHKLLKSVYFKLRHMVPCALCNLEFRIDLPEMDELQFTLLGMALTLGDPGKSTKHKRKNVNPAAINNEKKIDDDLIFTLEEDQIRENSIPITSQSGLLNTQFMKYRQKSPTRIKMNSNKRHVLMHLREKHGVDITSLSYIPGGKIDKYLGYLNFFFIRETNSIREGGGLSGFVHSFLTEVLAIVRAHVIALGGNAMVAYFMTECVLHNSTHKNQGQCLINVGGDVVFVSYFLDD